MANKLRFRSGQVELRRVRVDSGTVIEAGDLVYLDTDDVKPASDFPWDTNLATTQAAFAAVFLGVAHTASADGETDDVSVDVSPHSVYEFDVASAKVNLETYQDRQREVELAYVQALRALELLVGRYPAAEITARAEFGARPPRIPAGLPSELLERRPDVIAAQKRVAGAFSRVKESQAARLPRISLTGSVSDITSELFVLQDRDNPVWSIGGAVFAPLFTGGALKGQVEVRTAEQEQAVAQYVKTALAAFGDVENALSSEFALEDRETILAAAVNDAARALELAEFRYRVGSGDLRAVEQQQLAYHSSRMNLLRVQSERRVQRVNLHLALGGDFAASA